MSQLFDARGNEFQGALDQIGGGTVTDARVASATLSALNADILMDLNGKTVAIFDIRSAANVATYVFEGTIDGTNYYTIPARPLVGSAVSGSPISEAIVISQSVATTIAAAYVIGVSGFRRVRCRVSAFSSGSAIVTARASVSDFAIIAQPQPSLLTSNLLMTAIGPTAFITAPAAGLFPHITSLSVTMQATAAVTAVTPPTLTLSNLSAMVMNVHAIGAVGECRICYSESFPNPLKATISGTAINATLSALPTNATYRLLAAYYLAP